MNMFRIFLTVLKKELIEILRNKKALIASIIVPFVLFPSIFWFSGKIINQKTSNPDNIINVLVEDEITGNSSLTNYLKSIEKINVIQINSIKNEWNKGEMSLGLVIPKEFEDKISLKGKTQVELYYNSNSENSVIASYILSSYIEKFSDDMIGNRLESFGISDDNFNKVSIIRNNSSFEENYSNRFLAMILPMILIILSIAAPMVGVLDLGVGEKERGTMGALLTTQADRMSVVLGKFFAISTIAIITSVSAIEGLIFAITNRNGYIFDDRGLTFYLSNKAIVIISIILILTIMLFGALELTLSIYPKSIKEARVYLFPLTLITFIPIILAQSIDINNIPEKYFHIPVVNIVCLIKEIAILEINANHISVVIAWIVAYILISISIAIYLFNKEEVVIRY